MTRLQASENPPQGPVFERVDQISESFQVADVTAAVTDQLVKLMGDIEIGSKQVRNADIVANWSAHNIPCLLTRNYQV